MASRRKRTKQQIQKTLKNKCFRLWSELVRRRAGSRCEVCGSTKWLNAHHIVGKRYKPLRFALNNGISLCADHHKLKVGLSAHENPVGFTDWLRNNRPAVFTWLISIDYTKEQGIGPEEILEDTYKGLLWFKEKGFQNGNTIKES